MHACIHSPGFIFLLQLRGEVYDQFVNADQVAGVKVWLFSCFIVLKINKTKVKRQTLFPGLVIVIFSTLPYVLL